MRFGLVVLAAMSLPAAPAQDGERNGALRAWLLAPPRPESEGLLEPTAAAFADAGAVRTTLERLGPARTTTPGFRRIEVPPGDASGILAVVVPDRATPPTGFPLLLAPAPSLLGSPSELSLRARYGAWLDHGFVVAVPVPPHQLDAGRAILGHGVHDEASDLPPVAVAAVALELPLDRERVVFHARVPLPPLGGPTRTRPFRGDTTAFSAVYHLAVGEARLDDLAEPWLYTGRTVVHHLADGADEAALRAARNLKTALEAVQGRHRLLEDPAARYALRFDYAGTAPAAVAALLPRSPTPDSFDALLGGRMPATFEGLEFSRAHAATRIAVRGSTGAGTLSIGTPDDPTTPSLPLRIYVAIDEASPREVRLNGRPLVPLEGSVRASLLLARRNLQTGRRFTRVYEATP